MNLQSDSSWLSKTAALYVTQSRILTPSGGSDFLVLTANPRRWRVVFFDASFGPTMPVIVPGPIPAGFNFSGSINCPYISEFPKDPSGTTGEWYGSGAALTGWYVIETLYMGS